MRLVVNDPTTEQGRRKPDHHIADVDIVFDQTDGPLAGLKLVGTALWSRTDGEEGVTVTLPSRKVGGSSCRRQGAGDDNGPRQEAYGRNGDGHPPRSCSSW